MMVRVADDLVRKIPAGIECLGKMRSRVDLDDMGNTLCCRTAGRAVVDQSFDVPEMLDQ